MQPVIVVLADCHLQICTFLHEHYHLRNHLNNRSSSSTHAAFDDYMGSLPAGIYRLLPVGILPTVFPL
jgi:hypothetical protein